MMAREIVAVLGTGTMGSALRDAKTIGRQWDDALRAGFGDRDVAGAYLSLQQT